MGGVAHATPVTINVPGDLPEDPPFPEVGDTLSSINAIYGPYVFPPYDPNDPYYTEPDPPIPYDPNALITKVYQIQWAVDHANPGDTITVGSGTFYGAHITTPDITIIGSGAGTIINNGPLLFGSTGFIIIKQNGVKINNLKIIDVYIGILALYSNRCEFEYITINPTGNGIYLAASSECALINNTIADCLDGVFLMPWPFPEEGWPNETNDTFIQNNQLINCQRVGVGIINYGDQPQGSFEMRDNSVLNNYFENGHIFIGSTSDLPPFPSGTLIESNVFVGHDSYPSVNVYGEGARVQNNDYTDTQLPGWTSPAELGCVFLGPGTRHNYVRETAFPDGTTMCDQIMDVDVDLGVRGTPQGTQDAIPGYGVCRHNREMAEDVQNALANRPRPGLPELP
jgi:parallel beta-helix repeat protein